MRVLIAIFTLLIIGCTKPTPTASKLIAFIPNNAFAIIKINDLHDIEKNIQENVFFKQIEKTKAFSDFKNKLPFIQKKFPKQKGILCFLELGEKNIEYLFITKKSTETLNTPGQKIDSHTYNGYTIFTRTSKKEQPDFSSILGDFLINSSSKLVIENSIRASSSKKIIADVFYKTYQTTNDSCAFSILINTHNTNRVLKKRFTDKKYDISDMNQWISLDVTLTPESVLGNGISIQNDSVAKYSNLFKGLKPRISHAPDIVPANAQGFLSFSYHNPRQLIKNINQYRYLKNIPTIAKQNTVITHCDEIVQMYIGDKTITGLHMIDKQEIITILKQATLKQNYRGIAIYRTVNPAELNQNLFPIIDQKTDYYAVIKDFILYCDDIETLKNGVANIQNQTVLKNLNTYKEITSYFSGQSSVLIIGNSSFLKEKLEKENWSNSISSLDLSAYPHSGIQIVADQGFCHINTVLHKAKTKNKAKSIIQKQSVLLEREPIFMQLVKNHKNNSLDIIAQDSNHKLYAIDHNGKTLWKKQLSSPIQGEITQVDLYKNNRLQLAFSTENSFYILDRNGNSVMPFPLHLEEELTQPTAVFEYDNQKKYRFLLHQKNKLTMLDKHGKKVQGFAPDLTNKDINHTAKHFVHKTIDYIVYAQDAHIYMVNRKGQTKLKYSKPVAFSDNDIYFHKGYFTTTTKNGELLQINTNAKAKITTTALAKKHYIHANFNTFCSLSDNTLTINKQKKELDFGLYTRPSIVKIQGKDHVSITDLQAKKVYLFKEDTSLVSGFPVYGSSKCSIKNNPKNNTIELIVKGEQKNILWYQLR